MKISIFLVSQLYSNSIAQAFKGGVKGAPPPESSEGFYCEKSSDCISKTGRYICNFDDGNYGFCENCNHR